jgi:hypothetical protein
MKQLWEVFGDEYAAALKTTNHESAVVAAILAFSYESQRRNDNKASGGLGDLKLAADRWSSSGSGDRIELREILRHAWTDFVLRQ